jgi:hypothetical protein
MPPGAAYVGRGSRWGNPFAVGGSCSFGGALWLPVDEVFAILRSARGQAMVRDAATATAWFRELMEARPYMIERARRELRGKPLACWCALDQPCHADVLLELANAPLRCEATDA